MAAGWLILSVVDILWVLYFTSEEDSLTLHIFNSLGTGGLTPPSRRRRANRAQSVHNMGVGNGYGGGGGGYSSPSAVGATPYETKPSNNFGPAGVRSQGSLHTASLHDGVAPKSSSGVNASMNGGTPAMPMANLPADSAGMGSPLMGAGAAGVGAGGGPLPEDTSATPSDSNYMYKAKALYACEFPMFPFTRGCALIRTSWLRRGICGRPKRDFLRKRRGTRHHRQERQMVAGKESGWYYRQCVVSLHILKLGYSK